MPAIGIGLGLGGGAAGSAPRLTVDAAGYPAASTAGTVIAALSDPFTGQGLGTTSYAVFGSVPAQLALQGRHVAVRTGAASGGASYDIGVVATSGNGRHKIGEVLSFVACGASTSLLAGFALNGSINAVWKAARAGAAAGTRSGRIVVKGDSTNAGEGGGSNADAHWLTGARANRPASALAAQYRAAGVPMYDRIVCGDQGMSLIPGYALPLYDPRTSYIGTSLAGGDQRFAGGTSLSAAGPGQAITLTETCDGFAIDFYNAGGNALFAIDGAAPASGPASHAIPATLDGFSRVVVGAGSFGSHTLTIGADTGGFNIHAIRPLDSAQPAIDIVVHAVEGARAQDQAAASGNHWYSNDALAHEAPDLTIVNVGLKDNGSGVPVATYAAALQAMVATARLSGDVLLIFPHPSAPQYSADVTAYRDAAVGVAAANVAFLSLFDHYGGAFTPELATRLYDGFVHPKAEFYAEIAGVMREALELMAVPA